MMKHLRVSTMRVSGVCHTPLQLCRAMHRADLGIPPKILHISTFFHKVACYIIKTILHLTTVLNAFVIRLADSLLNFVTWYGFI
ncbi:hypothetical protein, partial [Viscerimonas tarda]